MPKIRDYWKRAGFAQKVALSLPVLLVMLGLGIVVANLVGMAMWQIEKARIEAAGETFDFAKNLPPSVPAEDNFCATPALLGLRFEENGNPRGRLENLLQWSSGDVRDYLKNWKYPAMN